MVFKEDDIEKAPTKTAKIPEGSSSLARVATHIESIHGNLIRITADDIMVPDDFYLAGERSILEILQDRLWDYLVKPPELSAQVLNLGSISD